MTLVVSPDNRGLAYGDGLFETCRVRSGQVPWWQRHLNRLKRGCEVLGFDWSAVTDNLDALRNDALSQHPDADWLKLIVTRVASGRGYASDCRQVERIWTTGKLSETAQPVRIGALIVQSVSDPLLAGLKHLNRLPDVLAANRAAAEGSRDYLSLDSQQRIVCASSANVFFVIDGRLVTPDIVRSGVAGIMREWVMEVTDVEVRSVGRGLTALASECFLTNALRGIVSVSNIGAMQFGEQTPVADALRRQLQDSSWAKG